MENVCLQTQQDKTLADVTVDCLADIDDSGYESDRRVTGCKQLHCIATSNGMSDVLQK